MTSRRSSRPVGDPLRAVAYIRGSKDEQKLTPEAQRAQIEAFAAREGIAVVAWYVEAVSGGAELADRPVLLAALAELRGAGAGVFLVAKRDRLARDLYLALTIERECVAAAGARVMTADGAANGNDLNDSLLRGILDVFSEHERGMIRARTRAALAAKKARGEHLGAVPYGYQRSGSGLVENEAEQGVLRVVRELRAAGLSQRAIVAELAKRGLVSRVGRPFQATQIARMLAA
jgi:DNA invertase Pin-like site-specific DNA recombinase